MDKYLNLLGSNVHVIVDRPLHSPHPTYGFKYSLNYGYIPGTIAEDQKEIDAYILGIDKPLKEFTGVVKAIIVRINDLENKLVVTPAEFHPTKEEIWRRTRFQEQFFSTEIIMEESIR